jgi:hypothetical protein
VGVILLRGGRTAQIAAQAQASSTCAPLSSRCR